MSDELRKVTAEIAPASSARFESALPAEARTDCEHERSRGEGPCPDCGMVMVLCRPCSMAGGADMPIYHGEPACPSSTLPAVKFKWPSADEICASCGHAYDQHNYSDSLIAETPDPLGLMYECIGGGYDTVTAVAACECARFERAMSTKV